ncbi:MAG: PorP/SprF family type IX secretion system membrane protein [Bacteroidales bacterium]|nr:PorP/SprF family type IX secretion system membrane protein [Bacteroidales bacterium]
MLRNKFIRSFIYFVAAICKILTVLAQDFHYSNMHENQININPAFITNIDRLAFQLSYRNQWPGSSDFITYNGAFIYTSERLNSSLGAIIFQDNQAGGIFTNTSFSLMYGYKTRIGKFTSISAGLSGAYNILNSNFSQLTLEDGTVPASIDGARYFDFSIGVELDIDESGKFGVSVEHITRPNGLKERKYNISYIGKYKLGSQFYRNSLEAEPLILFSYQNPYSELIYGGRINFNLIIGGLYLRQNLRFQFDALIILLGTHFGNISFFYTYDINLSSANARFTKLAAHEVTFLYNFKYKKKSIKKGAIKCPDI